MTQKKLFQQIEEHIDTIIEGNSALGKSLWEEFIRVHPADIAEFLVNLPEEKSNKLFLNFQQPLMCSVFKEFSEPHQAHVIGLLGESGKTNMLSCLTTDELSDLFEQLSDPDLKKYLDLLHKNDREKVLSLLKFNSESAGGIMNTDVLAFSDTITVGNAIELVQRVQPHRELHHKVFVMDDSKKLVGYILLEDLVMHKFEEKLLDFLRPNELVAQADEDRESIAKRMVHYNLTIVPVVGADNYFLGVIPSTTLVDIIGEEATEDVYKMSAMTPVKGTYFENSFLMILYQRSYILIALLLAQSLSSSIIRSHKELLYGVAGGVLIQFITMLISTGGNAGSQTSAVIIQGMASGEITLSNMGRFFKREFSLAFVMALILGVVAFARVFFACKDVLTSIAVSSSLAMIVFVSIIVGSLTPLLLRRINIDPAFSAGPFLATLMDIVGLLIYCTLSRFVFTYLL